MNLTPQQQAFLSALQTTKTSIALKACAGSGKTTTLVEGAKVLKGPVLALVFNARNKKEMEGKFPPHVTCLTLNGLGHRAWGRHVGRRLVPEATRVGDITRDVCKEADRPELWTPIRQLVSKAKLHGLVPSGAMQGAKGLVEDTPENWQDIADLYDIDFSTDAMDYAKSVLRRSIQAAFLGEIDFDDQLYMPVVYRSGFERFNTILVDEAQDLSPIQHEMIQRSLPIGGRLIAVGDPRQAIYQFRGAMQNSMELLAERFKLEWMPLSVSFRCPQAVVREAREITTDIEAADSALEGSVNRIDRYKPDIFPEGCAIVCRNNGPLLGMAYKLVTSGVGVVYVGRDFGKGLHAVIDKIGARLPIEQFREQLINWADREMRNAEGRETRIQSIEDKRNCLLALCDANGFQIAADLVVALQKIFAANVGKVTLSTVHRAKGLEWDHVFFLDSHLVPPRRLLRLAKENPGMYDEELENENNIRYVAVTRAKKSLTYITSEGWDA